MGRSEPTFFVEKCTDSYYNYDGINDYTNETEIRAAAALIHERNKGCWDYEEFRLPASDNKTYHFLEYSGRCSPFLMPLNPGLLRCQYPHLVCLSWQYRNAPRPRLFIRSIRRRLICHYSHGVESQVPWRWHTIACKWRSTVVRCELSLAFHHTTSTLRWVALLARTQDSRK